MHRRPRRVAFSVACALTAALAPSATAGAAPPGPQDGPSLPQAAAAQAAARWLAGQLSPAGWMPTSPGSGRPSLSFTANTVLALVAAHVDPTGVAAALGYLETHVDAFVTQDGADGPGQLALLILDAQAGGVDSTDFGGTDLVTRLLATEQPSGLFGTDGQLANYDAGNYEQGLALDALGVAGVKGQARLSRAIDYLVDQQCPDGGWSFTDQATDTCAVSASDYTGPDTNSTALAVQGLAAQGALTPSVAGNALAFYTRGQDADGGWSYYPSSSGAPQSTDPDSTAFVIQALIALGQSPAGPAFDQGAASPVSALLAFQLSSGTGDGAFQAALGLGSPDIFATYQAVPAVAGMTLAYPLGTSDGAYWVAGSDGAVSIGGPAVAHGSLPGLGLSVDDVVGLAAAPDGGGYWAAGADGGVFAFGSAGYDGSMGGRPLIRPIVGLSATPDGGGYWLVAADGGVFAFGDAAYQGSMGGRPLNSPIVGLAATPDGGGYWLVAADGGVFAFGDATYQGSVPGEGISVHDVVGLAAFPGGGGYWAVAADGPVYPFGTAPFHGSLSVDQPLAGPLVAMAATPDGGGYWTAGSDGGVFAFGDAIFAGVGPGPGTVAVAASAGRPA